MALASTFRTFQELAKSGIVALVLISVLGGYLAGHSFEREFDFLRLAVTLFRILFLASGSSALNQIQEVRLDASMPRTAKRPLPSGKISLAQAWIFVGLNLSLGFILLAWLDIGLLALGIAAVVSYNGLYTLWWKRKWAFAAVPGAVPGALPILMGFASAQRELFHPGGVYLFFILFFWQMPHFWVLALKYREDYRAGGFPTLPVAHGATITVSHIVLWCLAYCALALLAPIFLGVGTLYQVIAFVMSAKLLWVLNRFVREPESQRWLQFFLWINFSLIIYLAAAVIDLWAIYLIPIYTR